MLVEYFIDSFNTEFRKRVLGATPAAYALLQSYGWPGNVRELRNVIERAMLLSDGDRLDARDFSAMAKAVSAGSEFELPATGVDLEQLERSLLIQALRTLPWEPDPRRRAPRPQPRSDPVSHREIRAHPAARSPLSSFEAV